MILALRVIFGTTRCVPHGEIKPAGGLALAEQATERLRHRGPDERGSWVGEAVFLGMRRLSIIDLAGGQQPIWNEEGTRCIIFNGELYNFLDLRPDLIAKGHLFRSESDTEVVLHAYDEWGVDCLQHLNGMFAFAIWDKTKDELFVARDRVGEKPLYYYREAGRLLFSSEIKALLTDPKVPRELNPPGLTNFLTFGHSVAPETIYKNIFKLLPAHYLIASNGLYTEIGTSAMKTAFLLTALNGMITRRPSCALDDSCGGESWQSARRLSSVRR